DRAPAGAAPAGDGHRGRLRGAPRRGRDHGRRRARGPQGRVGHGPGDLGRARRGRARPARRGAGPRPRRADRLPRDDPFDRVEIERPLVLRLLVMGTEDGYEVLPGGVGITADDAPEALKDVWVTVPETSAVPAEGEHGPRAGEPARARGVLTAYPAMTRSIGS